MSGGSVLIRGGRVVDPSQKFDKVADVLVVDGKIAEVKTDLRVGPERGIPEVDAKGLVVSAGWVDIHTHLREPGGAHKETIATGALAAAAGGFTSIACMANTLPVNDNAFITSFIYQRAAQEAVVNVFAIGAISKGLKGEEMAEIGSMAEAGAVGISDDGMTLMNAYLMRKAMDYSKRFDLAVITHCEDACMKGRGVMNEGFNSARFGLRGIPATAEDVIVARDIALAELTGARLHIAHLSSRGSIRLVRDAKKRGVKVTAEATPHHLTLTDDAVEQYDTNTKVAPPLREKADVEALQEAVADGTVDVLATDHAPHAREDKDVEYDLAAFGMIGLETAFPVYNRLHIAGRLSLDRMIAAMTYLPARVVNLTKGTLSVGADGDLTVFDPQRKVTIDKAKFRSKSQNTPFHGWELQGAVRYTIVKGKVVYGGLT